ncbi:hypothetical protein [Thioalkalivibrio sp. ARh3]|uniref:hypothetical protein n=1 Tax=Thioalkalivibrio sp. ARh3 TaxID=1158148 RepID=UPI0012DF3B4B|nr:hypothetical protein [Thioalkalivibrio sp. ARh3]
MADIIMMIFLFSIILIGFWPQAELLPIIDYIGFNFEGGWVSYLVPVVGAVFVYNRYRARVGEEHDVNTVSAPGRLSTPSFMALVAVTMLLAVNVAFDSSFMAAFGFFAGVALASGAGRALRYRVEGIIGSGSQLVLGSISAVSLLGASWLGGWASIEWAGTELQGWYLAPLLGTLVGLTVPVQPTERRGHP